VVVVVGDGGEVPHQPHIEVCGRRRWLGHAGSITRPDCRLTFKKQNDLG
jgi:hypothetical protein